MRNRCRLSLLAFGLWLPAVAGAQTGVALLVTTDMSCNWKLDGQPMGQLVAGDPKVLVVSEGEHRIEAATADGLATSQTKAAVDQVQRTVDIKLKLEYDHQLKIQKAEAAGEKPTWTDPATKLMWTKWDNGSDVDWNQATAYCSRLQLAGYSGWRLPTIEELEGIRDPSINVRTTFDNGYVERTRQGQSQALGMAMEQ